MEWTDIQITVPQQYAETAEAIATMVSNGGIYIEDYRDLEQQAWEDRPCGPDRARTCWINRAIL